MTKEIEQARSLALKAVNDLAIVLSWVAAKEQKDYGDERDPDLMIKNYLESAEIKLTEALEKVKQGGTE